DLARERTITPDNLELLEIGICGPCIPQVAQPEVSRKNPKNIVDGQFSVYFGAAVALLDGHYDWRSYDRIGDERVRQTMARMSVFESPIDVVIATTRSGDRIRREVRKPLGEPENFLTWSALLAKVTSLAGAALR